MFTVRSFKYLFTVRRENFFSFSAPTFINLAPVTTVPKIRCCSRQSFNINISQDTYFAFHQQVLSSIKRLDEKFHYTGSSRDAEAWKLARFLYLCSQGGMVHPS